MRVPIRKPGQYTHLRPDPKVTAEKYAALKANLERLKKTVRPRAAEEVKRLALMGDFSENAAYGIAKGKLRGINQRIIEIEDHLRRAEIIAPPSRTHTAAIGHFVTVETGGRERTYHILGSSETDPDRGVISHASPLGRALIGKRVGDTVDIALKNKRIEYRIVKIA